MKTANYRMNEKVENFNLKLNKLREELNEYKKNSVPVSFLNNKNLFISKSKHDAKKRELYATRNDEALKTIHKRTNGGCALKEKKNTSNAVIELNKNSKNSNNKCYNGNTNTNETKKISNVMKNENNKGNSNIVLNEQKNANAKTQANETMVNTNIPNKYVNNKVMINGTQTRMLQLPLTRAATTKFVKTKTNTATVNENLLVPNIKDKKKFEKTDKTNKTNKINEKKWLAATKNVKIDIKNPNESKPVVEPKKKHKFLYFEGEDGSVQVYPLYADADIGFHNITKVDDENLSQVKRENQDDDDIKTTKRLAEWSSELVYKHLKETVEKSKSFFKNNSAESIREDLLRRMYD